MELCVRQTLASHQAVKGHKQCVCLSELRASACAVYTHCFQLIRIFALTYDENGKRWLEHFRPYKLSFWLETWVKKNLNIAADRWSLRTKDYNLG